MLLEQLRRMFQHAEWANDLVSAALERDNAISGDIVELFAHVLGAEEIWLSRLEGRPAALPVWPTLDVGQLRGAAQATAAGYRAYLDRLTSDDLTAVVAYTNSAGQAFQTPIVDILTHVAMHGSYHRGQVALRMRREGGTPVPTDFIAFARGVAAATRQPPAN